MLAGLLLLKFLIGVIGILVAAVFSAYKYKRAYKYGKYDAGGQDDCPVHFLLYLMVV